MKQTKKKDSDVFFQDLKNAFGIVGFVFRSLFNPRHKATFVVLSKRKKKHDGLIHNLLYTNVGFTLQTTDGEMIAVGGGVGVEGKVSGAVRVTVGNRWECCS